MNGDRENNQGTSTAERNKEVVLDFIEKAVNLGDLDAASRYFGEGYVQHNPNIPDGIEGFNAYVRQLRSAFPQVRAEVKRIVAEGDYVVVHMFARREQDDMGLAIVDFFRLSEGKLVEHWEDRKSVV